MKREIVIAVGNRIEQIAQPAPERKTGGAHQHGEQRTPNGMDG
ncbi:hypothetical protein [Paraburkholderia solisilvae]